MPQRQTRENGCEAVAKPQVVCVGTALGTFCLLSGPLPGRPPGPERELRIPVLGTASQRPC